VLPPRPINQPRSPEVRTRLSPPLMQRAPLILAITETIGYRRLGDRRHSPELATRCRGLRRSDHQRRAPTSHQVFHPFSSLPAARNRAPKAIWLFDWCLNYLFFQKIIWYSTSMSFLLDPPPCSQDLMEFGLTMVGLSGKFGVIDIFLTSLSLRRRALPDHSTICTASTDGRVVRGLWFVSQSTNVFTLTRL
jgi:hypothetical protein